MPLQPNDINALIAAAQSVYGEFSLDSDFSAGSCAAAIQTACGRIFTGICVDVACGIGFCAEHAAIAEMLKHERRASGPPLPSPGMSSCPPAVAAGS